MPPITDPGPIFIVGYLHTGSTLFRNILGGHSRLFTLYGESHFFEDLSHISRRYPALHDEAGIRVYVRFIVALVRFGSKRAARDPFEYADSDLGLTSAQFDSIVSSAVLVARAFPNKAHVPVFRSTVRLLMQSKSKARWVEKTPAHVHYINQILTEMPDALIIDLVRDPRAALASRKARTEEQWRETRIASGAIVTRKVLSDPVVDSYIWRAAVRAGSTAASKYPRSLLRIRYEDLVARPRETIELACRFVGVDFEPAMLEVGWVNSTTQRATRGSFGIGSGAVEKWKELLSPGETFVIQRLLRREMALLNYAPASVSWRAVLAAPLLLAQSVYRAAARFVRRRVPSIDHRSHSKALSVLKDLFGRHP